MVMRPQIPSIGCAAMRRCKAFLVKRSSLPLGNGRLFLDRSWRDSWIAWIVRGPTMPSMRPLYHPRRARKRCQPLLVVLKSLPR